MMVIDLPFSSNLISQYKYITTFLFLVDILKYQTFSNKLEEDIQIDTIE